MIDPPRPVFDLVVHEQDLRGAIGVPGARDSAGVRWLVDIALARLASEIDEANLPALEIAMEDEGFVAGSGDVVDRWDIERFELFRSVAGRRSANQLRASGCPLGLRCRRWHSSRWRRTTSSRYSSLSRRL